MARPALLAWGYFWVALIPVLGLVDVYYMRYSLVADHYEHLAIIGVVVLAAAAWRGFARRAPAPAFRVVPLLVLAALGWADLAPNPDVSRQPDALSGDDREKSRGLARAFQSR